MLSQTRHLAREAGAQAAREFLVSSHLAHLPHVVRVRVLGMIIHNVLASPGAERCGYVALWNLGYIAELEAAAAVGALL